MAMTLQNYDLEELQRTYHRELQSQGSAINSEVN